MNELSFTHIYEGARAHFNLSRDEYALCNYIQVWASYPGFVPGWCNRTQKQMAAFIGITDRAIRKMLLRLEKDGLIERNGANGMCRITKEWFEVVMLEKKKTEEQSSASTGTKFLNERNKVPHQQEQSSAHKERLNKVYLEKEEIMSSNADAPIFEPVKAEPKKEKSPRSESPPSLQEILTEKIEDLRTKYKAATDPKEQEKITRQGEKLKKQLQVENDTDAAILRLNEKAGFSYRLTTKEARQILAKRLATDSIEDIFMVIDFKSKMWANEENLREYLRPSTLFNGKFEGYYQAALQAKKPVIEKPNNQTAYTTPKYFNPDKYKRT